MVNGPLGELSQQVPQRISIEQRDGEGSPNPRRNRNAQDEIDFGDLGGDDAEGEDDDDDDYNNRDIEPMDIGPPARQETTGHDRKPSDVGEVAAADDDDDDEDDLEALMMRGLEGGDSSEESEEE